MTEQHSQPNNETAPGLSIASLVMGILSILGGVFLVIPPILAIVFGHVSRSECKRKAINAGKGMALAGLILGYITLIPVPIGLMAAMAIPAFQKVRETSQKKVIIHNLTQIASAADQYFLETGKESVRIQSLMGEYLLESATQTVAGEIYPSFITVSDTTIVATFPNGDFIDIPYASPTFSNEAIKETSDTSHDSALAELKNERRKYAISYDPTIWERLKGGETGDVEFFLKLKDEDAYAMAIYERIPVPLDNLKKLVLENMKAASENARITNEKIVEVNGENMLYLRLEALVDGISMIYKGHYASGDFGTIQLLTYTHVKLEEEYQEPMESLLNGLRIVAE